VGHLQDKTDNPIVALAAGPGTGKSRFLDEFAAACTDPQRLANVSNDDKELCDALAGCIPVRVTFNSYSAVHPIETRYGFDVVQALVYRMLFAYPLPSPESLDLFGLFLFDEESGYHPQIRRFTSSQAALWPRLEVPCIRRLSPRDGTQLQDAPE
jgi:hypothetical protein